MTTPFTPRRSLARPRPSINNLRTDGVPAMPMPMLSPASMIARKQSFQQLTQNSSKDSGYEGSDGNLEIGDSVNVPGGMYGVVRFVGSVKGKSGMFVGVELEGPHAIKGKNDGTVEGTRYFTTTTPHSGVFFPLSRATLRHSGSSTRSVVEQMSPTLTVTTSDEYGDESPLAPPRKPFAGRPSLPRPQSPASSTPRPSLLPSTPRSGSAASNRSMVASPAPGRLRNASVSNNSGQDSMRRTSTMTGLATPSTRDLKQVFRRPSNAGMHTPRAGSALSFTSELSATQEITPNNTVRGNSAFTSKLRASKEEDKGMIAVLTAQLSAKDHQLKEQANSLQDMESSLNELQTLLSETAVAEQERTPRHSSGGRMSMAFEGDDAMTLRQLLREKNEKIEHLNVDFDAHRADFRSTIDTLEMAASETERVYEKRVEDLIADCRELQHQNAILIERNGDDDVESVVRQLKQLESLVAELEEGLEDARRGEAEARAEAEHFRGESERSREELRREREKASAFERRFEDVKEEVERRQDEIRGLKSIIHSLSRDRVEPSSLARSTDEDRLARERLVKEVAELQDVLQRKTDREEELEKEIDRLKSRKSVRIDESTPEPSASSVASMTNPERKSSLRSIRSLDMKKTPTAARLQARSPSPSTSIEDGEEEGKLWCEICETQGHDILTCGTMFAKKPLQTQSVPSVPSAPSVAPTTRASVTPQPLHLTEKPKTIVTAESPIEVTVSGVSAGEVEGEQIETEKVEERKSLNGMVGSAIRLSEGGKEGMVAGKASGVIDATKWCALCEADGHDSVDCPVDDF